MSEPIRILCTGDLHLGRTPRGIPDRASDLTVEYVFSKIVRYALEERVDAFVLTGDVVDQENKFYEAVHILQEGIRDLTDAGISVYAVAGNHDYDVFPRVVQAVNSERFRLLGAKGQWEHIDLIRDHAPVARLIGWSFPTQHHFTSSLSDFPEIAADVPIIGLLHADLDVADSRYGPVATYDLLRHPVDVWVLGHQHAPQKLPAGSARIIYPGSPQPLRAPETGVRGPVVVTIEADKRISVEWIPLATLRYATRSIDVGSIDSPDDLDVLLVQEIERALEEFQLEQPDLEHMVLRIVLTGRTSHHRHLPVKTQAILQQNEDRNGGYTLSRIVLQTMPEYDLEELAAGSGIPAELARTLRSLRDETEATEALMAGAKGYAEKAVSSPAFRLLNSSSLTVKEDEIREMFLEEGYLLLDTLLAQPGES